MIDTINFRLNNVRSNYPIIATQYERTTKDGKTTMVVDQDTGEFMENTKIRAIMHHDTNTIIPLTKRSSLYIASSHYSVSYQYNLANDYIDFNLSVPKAIYGTNIIQFVKYYSQESDIIYNALIDFVKGFTVKYFIEPVNLIDIELTRLDFCYNQLFNSKYDALKYLTEQKSLMVKYARSSKNDYRAYDTSVFYYTKRYSFKIYHKGTEFKKHDKRELAKKNPTKHSIPELEEISDRMLRYEVTFRKSQIDYLFEKAELQKKYLPDSFNQSWTRLINRPQFERYLTFVQQSKHYVFGKYKDKDEYVNHQTVTFCNDIFREMYNFFWQKVKDYQLQCRLSLFEVQQKIDQMNAKKEGVQSQKLRDKLSFNKSFLTTLCLLTQYYSLDDLRKSGLLPKSTFYANKKRLEQLGVTSEGRLVDMPPPTIDYMEYFYYFSKQHLN